METLTIDEAAKAALKGEKLMIGVYGKGVDITVAVDRKDVAEVINNFTQRFPARDPMAMAKAVLRAMTLWADWFPPEAQAKLIAPALVLADSAPNGIDGAMGIEVTIRKKGFLVEIFDLANLKTSRTVH